MLVVMENHATPEQIDRVVKTIEEMGYSARPMPGETRTTVGLVGNDGRVDGSRVEGLPGSPKSSTSASRTSRCRASGRNRNTIVTIAPGVSFGGDEIVIIAGPCSVESEEQIIDGRARRARRRRRRRSAAARSSRAARRTPFRDSASAGWSCWRMARQETGLPIVTEALDEEGAHVVAEYADCIQVGARNMQNYSLLRAVGRIGKPVLLKRGMAATITELLMSAEYILAEGNGQVDSVRAGHSQLRHDRRAICSISRRFRSFNACRICQ